MKTAVAVRTLPERKALFLEALAASGNVTLAARAARIARQHAYTLREDDPDFKSAWDKALILADGAIDDEIRRRALRGVRRPVFYKGAVCGVIFEYSDRMLELLAQRRMPEYRPKANLTLDGDLGLGDLARAIAAAKGDGDAA